MATYDDLRREENFDLALLSQYFPLPIGIPCHMADGLLHQSPSNKKSCLTLAHHSFPMA